MTRAYVDSGPSSKPSQAEAKSTPVDRLTPADVPGSTTVRIRTGDKLKLDRLCVRTHRGICDMLAYLIDEEEKRQFVVGTRKHRKAS